MILPSLVFRYGSQSQNLLRCPLFFSFFSHVALDVIKLVQAG